MSNPNLDMLALHRRLIGFDQLFDEIARSMSVQKQDNYPPFNIIRKSATNYRIEIAVAGFLENELDVELTDNVLHVRGESQRNEDASYEYLHRGISTRNFHRTHTLADNVEVRGAVVSNGIMAIELEQIVPEESRKKIAITFAK
jgi:molecular chaperone IbpA